MTEGKGERQALEAITELLQAVLMETPRRCYILGAKVEHRGYIGIARSCELHNVPVMVAAAVAKAMAELCARPIHIFVATDCKLHDDNLGIFVGAARHMGAVGPDGRRSDEPPPPGTAPEAS